MEVKAHDFLSALAALYLAWTAFAIGQRWSIVGTPLWRQITIPGAVIVFSYAMYVAYYLSEEEKKRQTRILQVGIVAYILIVIANQTAFREAYTRRKRLWRTGF